jgi:hypothetical protein
MAYTCSISGVEADPSLLVDAVSDDFGTSPPGWIQVTFRVRTYNPAWVAIQQAKEVMFQQAVAQLGPLEDAQVAPAHAHMRTLVSAQFAALESITETYVYTEEQCWVSDVREDAAVRASFNEILETLGLPAVEVADEGR